MKFLSILSIFCFSSLIAFGQTNESKIAFNKSLKHYRLKEYKEAIPHLELAVEKSPDFIEAYRMMAHCYDGLNNIDKAIESYKLALSINPNLEKPLYNLGLLYISKKEYEEAETYLEKAVNISPNYVAAKTKLEKLQQLKTGNSDENTDSEQPEGFVPPTFEELTPIEENPTGEELTDVIVSQKKSKKELRKERKAKKKREKAARKKRKEKS